MCRKQALDFFQATVVACVLIKASYCSSGLELTVSNVTENKVHVEWTSVLNSAVPIEKYQVSAYPITSYGKKDGLFRNEWTFYNTTFRSDLVGLNAGTLYNISVWAITSEGYTEPTTKNIWTEVGSPEEPPPVSIWEKHGRTMVVKLPLGRSENGPITGYNVVVVERSPITFFIPDELGDFAKSQETGVPFYITANLSPEEANHSFTIGDEQKYNGFYNAPLMEQRDYEVLVGVISSLNSVSKVTYSALQSSAEEEKRNDFYKAPNSSILSVILSAAIGVFGFLLVISVIIYFLLRKHYGKRRPSDEMVLKAHGPDHDENGFVGGMLQIEEDANLSELYEKIREQYWQIPRSHVDVGQSVLGIGQFGEIREAVVRRRAHTIPCIVQRMQAPSALLEKEKRNLLRELDIMSRCSFHTNIVEFLGACDEREVLQVAIEHHSTSLRGLLLRSRLPPGGKVTSLSEPLLLELAAGVAQGMAHLTDRGIYHTHLSTRNVVIAEGSIPKIAHFGLGYYNPLGKKLLYTRWTAPETINLNTFSSKSDVWSFGVLLWEILTIGGSPYYGLLAKDILPRVMQGLRLPQPEGVFRELYQLMLQCWELDPDERPKFMELASQLQNMFLNSKDHINFQACSNFEYEKFDPGAEDQ